MADDRWLTADDMKTCRQCKRLLVRLDDFSRDSKAADGHRGTCKRCEADRVRTRGGTSAARSKRLSAAYGLSVDDFSRMLAGQGFRCANPGCGEPLDDYTARVDHDHKTGQVRSLLCNPCNVTLGFMRDDPERIRGLANYLNEHS